MAVTTRFPYNSTPTFRIPYFLKGRFTADLVYRTICSTEPTNCDSTSNWTPEEINEDVNHEDDWKSHYGMYFLTLLLVLVLIGCVLYCWKRKIQRDLNMNLELQISDAVSHYMALSEKRGEPMM